MKEPDTKLRWAGLYTETELYKAAVRLYTKPLFSWHKALSLSSDGKTLFDFARKGLQNLDAIHQALTRQRFQFRPGLALHRNFNGKHRTLYVFPWEERLVDLLLYRLLNQALNARFSRSSYAYRLCGFGVDRCQRNVARVLAKGRPLFVMKRDISDFFGSINHELLLEKLAALVDGEGYLFTVLRQRVQFAFMDSGDLMLAERGVPFGTAIACLFSNLYLANLDRRLEAIPNLRFFRYADDLLAVSPKPSSIERAGEEFRDEMTALKLHSKLSHQQDFVFGSGNVSRFHHLGLEFRSDGSVGLSRDKFRKIRNLFRFAFRRNKSRFRRIVDKEKRARLAVEIAQRTMQEGVRNVAIIDYYLRHVTDEEQLRRLDRWLAEEVLFMALGGGHKKGHFRSLPFHRLRSMGLPSLVHRRRLILHGHLETQFFIWRNHQVRKGHRGTAARPRATTVPAFSQCPEAAAETSS